MDPLITSGAAAVAVAAAEVEVTPSQNNLEVDYGSEENAHMVCTALAVDDELQPDKAKRHMSVCDGKLLVHFQAVEARFLRASCSTFLDILTLATRTIEEFGTGMKM